MAVGRRRGGRVTSDREDGAPGTGTETVPVGAQRGAARGMQPGVCSQGYIMMGYRGGTEGYRGGTEGIHRSCLRAVKSSREGQGDVALM